MTDYRLLKSQKNEVFLLIQEAGLSPFEFGLEECTEENENGVKFHSHRLVHKPSTYALTFGEGFVTYSPGAKRPTSWEARPNWSGMLEAVQRWLGYLKREVEAPDLWAALAEEQELLHAETSEGLNTPFNAEEQAQIKQGVDQLRTYLTNTYSLAGENLRVVNAKLDYLIGASKELGRVHWKDIFVSTVIGIAWQLALPAPGFHDMFRFAGQILRHVLSPLTSLPLIH